MHLSDDETKDNKKKSKSTLWSKVTWKKNELAPVCVFYVSCLDILTNKQLLVVHAVKWPLQSYDRQMLLTRLVKLPKHLFYLWIWLESYTLTFLPF